MANRFEPILGRDDVFVFRDCCNVYLLKDGAHGILIDLGSGAALDRWQEVGVARLDGVYFTHAHRDQCQGAGRAIALGVPLRFPAAARSFVAAAERRDLTDLLQHLRGYPGKFDPPRPTAICPSHGEVIQGDCWGAFERTGAALHRLAELKDTICPRRPHVRRLVRVRGSQLMQVSPHLWVWNNSYFLLSEAGGAMMVDAQGALPNDFWAQWRERLGDRRIEVVLVTHVHLDHVEGIELLQEWQRAHRQPPCAVWAQEQVATCIESPHRHRRPYMALHPTPVDRRLGHRERFAWHEYKFVAYHTPGQTDLHAAYETTIDGHHAVLSGDNFYPAQQWGGTGGLCGYNGGHPDRWRASIALMMEIEPEWVLASHVQPHLYRREDYEAMLRWTDEVSAAMRALSPDGSLERHHDPHLISLHPYTQVVGGERLTVTAQVRNTCHHTVAATLTLRLPDGFAVDHPTTTLTIPAHRTGEMSWEVTFNGGAKVAGTQMVTVDVTFDGVYLGEKAECYLRCGF